MKLRYVSFILAIALFASAANASLQKPNWGIGDYWEYNGRYSVDEETKYENMSVHVSIQTHDLHLKLRVEGIESININGEEISCYKTKLTSSSSGTISIEGNLGGKPVSYSGSFNLDGGGYIYFSIDGLKVAKNDLIVNISTDISLPNMPSGALSVTMEYSPPLDFMNFSVEEGEKWTANSTVTISYGGMSTQNPVSFSFECIGKQGSSTYVIKSGYNPFEEFIPVNNTLIFWDSSVGMIREIKDIGGTQSLDIKLTSSQYSNVTNEPPVADFTWQPANPKAGDNVIFHSNSYDNDGTITSYLWEFGDGKSSTAANPSHVYHEAGNYTVKLTVTDNYGATSYVEKNIVVGGGGGSGGNGTPGFELALLIAALLAAVWGKFSIFK